MLALNLNIAFWNVDAAAETLELKRAKKVGSEKAQANVFFSASNWGRLKAAKRSNWKSAAERGGMKGMRSVTFFVVGMGA